MTITYLSDTDPDYACLEKYLGSGEFGPLQDAIIHEGMRDLQSMQETFRKVAEGIFGKEQTPEWEKALTSGGAIPTRFDAPSAHRIVQGLIHSIQKAAADLKLDAHEFPHSATIPTGLVNARAVKLPCSARPFLLFDSQIFLYCHLFAKAFAFCLPITNVTERVHYSLDLDDVKKHLDKNRDALARFGDILHAYAVLKHPGRAESYLPKREYIPLINTVRDGMELFLVGHEFGHVYADHLEKLLPGSALYAITESEMPKSHFEEHQADAIGLLLTLKSMNDRGYDGALSFVGVDLLFAALDLSARVRFLFDNGTMKGHSSESSPSHPSVEDRRNLLRMIAKDLISPEDQAEGAIKLAEQYAKITELIWAPTETVLGAVLSEGHH